MSWWEDVLDFGKDVLYDTVVGADGKEKSTLSDLGLLLSLGGGYLLGDSDMAKPDITPTGYQGKVKEYTAVRDRVPMQPDPNRRPGEGGRRYFSDIQYAARPATTPPTVEEARAASQAQAAELAQGNTQNFRYGGLAQMYGGANRPSRFAELRDRLGEGRTAMPQGITAGMSMPAPSVRGGLQDLARGPGFAQGGYLKGATDGMADEVPATIDGRQEARLSDGEFVIPADVVSHLGNGNSEAGAKVLEQMMSRVRKERTGNAKQGKQINPEKMTPK